MVPRQSRDKHRPLGCTPAQGVLGPPHSGWRGVHVTSALPRAPKAGTRHAASRIPPDAVSTRTGERPAAAERLLSRRGRPGRRERRVGPAVPPPEPPLRLDGPAAASFSSADEQRAQRPPEARMRAPPAAPSRPPGPHASLQVAGSRPGPRRSELWGSSGPSAASGRRGDRRPSLGPASPDWLPAG